MPVYEFECLDCKKSFEIIEPLAKYDPKKVRCPGCGSDHVERKWSAVFVETSKKS